MASRKNERRDGWSTGITTSSKEISFLATRRSNVRQLPGIAPRAVEPLVGFGIVDELPFFRVPAQLAVIPVGQVAQVTDGHGAGADFHIAQGPLSRADAVQPVALMAGRFVEMDVLVTE